MPDSRPLTFYEFFAGGGMARLGLGDGWRCLLANDHDPAKARAYIDNFGGDHFDGRDVHEIGAADLPGHSDMAWASFPCQDLSLAGARAGLARESRSGAFFGFWRAMQALDAQGRAPRLIVLENVVGMLSSRGGADFTALCELLQAQGYRFGALEIDAALFVPQSRQRVFVVAQKTDTPPPAALTYAQEPPANTLFHGPAVRRAAAALPDAVRAGWVWWRLPAPAARRLMLADLLEDRPDPRLFLSAQETRTMLGMMAPLHMQRVRALQKQGGKHACALYRRTRDVRGRKTQRAEARFDGLAGCLRTPAGGSSRQFVLLIEGKSLAVRRLSAREYARLMGLPDSYRLPGSETAGLHLAGDGVAAPCVAFLARELLEKLLTGEAFDASGQGAELRAAAAV